MKKKTSNKSSFHSVMAYPVIVHEDNESSGFWVECPILVGCYSQGKTIDECLVNIKEAISLCLSEKPAIKPAAFSAISLHFVQV